MTMIPKILTDVTLLAILRQAGNATLPLLQFVMKFVETERSLDLKLVMTANGTTFKGVK